MSVSQLLVVLALRLALIVGHHGRAAEIVQDPVASLTVVGREWIQVNRDITGANDDQNNAAAESGSGSTISPDQVESSTISDRLQLFRQLLRDKHGDTLSWTDSQVARRTTKPCSGHTLYLYGILIRSKTTLSHWDVAVVWSNWRTLSIWD